MIAVVEIPKIDLSELINEQDLANVEYEIVEPKKLIGAEDVIQWVVQLSSAALPIFINYLVQRKNKQKTTKVTIEGLNIKYSSKEELTEILSILAKQKAQNSATETASKKESQ